MKTIRELLRDADPLQHEPTCPSGQRDFRRQAVLTAASGARAPARGGIEVTDCCLHYRRLNGDRRLGPRARVVAVR